jgi:hypothetical protein
MTPSVCSGQCAGFKFFGVQAGWSCFCGDTYGSTGKAPESECNSPCRGNSALLCGGGFRNGIFAQPAARNASAIG